MRTFTMSGCLSPSDSDIAASRFRRSSEVVLERLDLRRAHHQREALDLARAHRRDLVVERLLGDPIGASIEQRAVQRPELLRDELLARLLPDEPFLLAVLLERTLGRVDLRLLLLQSVREPAGRLGRRREAKLERLLDVELGERVHGARRHLRVVGAEVQVHEPRAGHRLHLDAGAERRGGGRQRHAARVDDGGRRLSEEPLQALPGIHHRPGRELRMRLQIQPLDRALGERAALQELVLSLVVVHPALDQLDELLVGQDVRGIAIDQDLRRGLVDGARRVVVKDGDRQAEAERGQDDRATLVEHRQVLTRILQHCLLAHDTSPAEPSPGPR